VLNRASRRAALFGKDDDYRMFLQVLASAKQRFCMRLLDFAVMQNHWHLILWPDEDLQLSRFMHWLTTTHTQRWHAAHHTAGTGPLYQGRYKAIPIQSDAHFWTVARYVERNPVRAGLVESVQDWQWSSAWHRCNNCDRELLDAWPIAMPDDWLAIANEPQNQIHLSKVRDAIAHGRPFGDEAWCRQMASTLGLEHTFRPEGRPRKSKTTPDPFGTGTPDPYGHSGLDGEHISPTGRTVQKVKTTPDP
jgi:putative transposase